MRVLVVEHHETPSHGVVGQTLAELGVDMDVYWGAQGEALERRCDDYDGLVVLGGAMNAHDDEQCPYFPKLTSLIRDFGHDDKPVLGICLGSQLIARAYGAEPKLNGFFEFGFHHMAPTADGLDDPIFKNLGEGLNLFQWHTDNFDLPEQALHLAGGEHYANQAFRIGRATYATQFHFEVDRPLVQGWIDSNKPMLSDCFPDYENWLHKQFDHHVESSNAFCRKFVQSWLDIS